MSRLREFGAYISERYAIHQRRLKGEPPPWTEDPILRDWKFTNVKREWDRTTRALRAWTIPHARHRLLGLNMALARFTGRPETWYTVGYQRSWRPDVVARRLAQRAEAGHKVFTGAYLISNWGRPGSKVDVVVHGILTPLYDSGLLLPARLRRFRYLEDLHQELVRLPGFGHFMAQEIEQDLVHTPGLPLWRDADSFAVAGPGAMRGIMRVLEQPLRGQFTQEDARRYMQEWRMTLIPHLPEGLLLSAHDVEFNLCEFDKYERVRTGQGTPRARFTPTEDV
jgi:hypothetical protein